MATEVAISEIDTPANEQPDVMGEIQHEYVGNETASGISEKQMSETAVVSDSSAHGAEMLIRLKEGAGYVYSVPKGYIAQMAEAEISGHGDGIAEPEQSVTSADSQKTSSTGTKQNSIAIQANDYEIERRSGVLPARRRLVPFKFRDFQNSIDLTVDDPEDDDYDPSEEVPEPKRPRKTTPRPGARGVGRPRKVRKDHAYDRSGEVKGQAENSDAAEGTNQEGEQSNDDTAKKKADRQFPRRGRPPKDDPYQRPKVFKCLQCDKKFSLKGNLKVHMRTHTDERPFKCELPECGKSFRSNESLRRHNLAHQGIKLFACDICEKRFSSNVALTEHMARHTDIKSHICSVCQRAFRQLSCLRRHMTTHTDSQPYQCKVCEKRFSQAVYLRSHMRSHTGERPYQCDTCGKSFAHQSDKMRHMTIHLGTKPYPCEVCEARFSDPSTRRRHVREHNGFKPYTCQLCGDNFKRSGQLKAHLNKKHMNYKDDVLITKEGPFNALQFQFKGNKNTGVAEQLQAEQLAAGSTTTKYVQQQQHVVTIPGQEGQVITLAPGQDNIQVIDENGQIQHLQIQHVDMGGEQPVGQTQVLGQLQQQLVQTPVEQQQQQLEGYQIILPQNSSGSQEELLEETQQIIQQIQSQLEPGSDLPGGGQVKVAYQILHDDDNQQIVEIHYHQVGEEAQKEADSGQAVVTLLEDQDQAEIVQQQQNSQQQEELHQQDDFQQQEQQQYLQQQELQQEEQQQESLRQEQLKPEQIQNEHLVQEEQEQLTEKQIEVELMEAAQNTEYQQVGQQQEGQVTTLEQYPEQDQLPTEEHETAVDNASPPAEQLGAVFETDKVAVSSQEVQEFAGQSTVDCHPMEEQVLHIAPVQHIEDYNNQQETEQLPPSQEEPEHENQENLKLEEKQIDGPESEVATEQGQYGQKVLDSGEATLLTLQTLEQQQQQASVDYVSNPDFGCQEYYNWLSNFTELCKLVPIPLDVDLFQKISQVHKTLSDVLATPRGILTNKENFRTLMNISRELNGIISEHLNFVLHNLDTDIDME